MVGGAHPAMTRFGYTMGGAVGVMLVTACAQSYAPVSERAPPPDAAQYHVRPNDTLYSIAWRFGLDVTELANRNGLDTPYVIRPGQWLRVDRRAAPRTGSAAPGVARGGSPGAGERTQSEISGGGARSGDAWPPPTNTAVLAHFGAGGSAMEFALDPGTQIRAIHDGTVVYAGNGLGGYTTLVIVDHGAGLLSAYSSNVDPQVTEGDAVLTGSLVGRAPQRRDLRPLRFEMRLHGVPRNPADYLR